MVIYENDEWYLLDNQTLTETRRPSILPVPDMFTGSTLNITGQERSSEDASGESEDEVDDVPWRSPSEMIA